MTYVGDISQVIDTITPLASLVTYVCKSNLTTNGPAMRRPVQNDTAQ